MENKRWIIYNGDIIGADKPVVPAESRGLMYGDGCFETLRVYAGRYFKLQAHLDRLRAGASFLGISYPDELKTPSVKQLVHQLLGRNSLPNNDAIIRIQVWRGGSRGYGPEEDARTHYSIIATPLADTDSAVRLATVDIKRIPSAALPAEFKLCNNINYIVAAARAREKDASDALMQTLEGHISETTIGNLFWISGKTVFTPSKACDLLPGITREVLIDIISQKDGLTIKEGVFTPEDLGKAEAVWMTNSVRELQPVKQIDDQVFDTDHPVFKSLEAAFKKHLEENLRG